VSNRTVIVGSGSSGGVLASRLSEDADRDVVLIEAGPDYPDPATLPATLRAQLPDLATHDWGLDAVFTEERPASPYPRGKLVGGSSVVNGSVAIRGTPQDYDDWLAAGNTGWGYEDVLPFLRKLEHDLDFEGDLHGADGPIPVRRTPLEELPAVLQAFVAACRSRGFDSCPDHNDPSQTGIGPLPRNEIDGLRASTLATYLKAARTRPNLEIRADTTAIRVVWDGPRTTGVELAGGEVVEGDEIVLSAGAIGTPHILMHSGIGPADALAAAGIECRLELPGVGRSLRDHGVAPLVALPREGESWPMVGYQVMLKYPAPSTGRRDALFILGATISAASLVWDTPPDIENAFSFAPVLGKPVSTGWVAPVSADPLDDPEIHLNFLSDPRDRQDLAEVARLAYSLATESELADHLSEVRVPTAEDMLSDESIERWLVENATTGFHPVGTCRMAPDGDGMAVVDPSLRVREFDNLHIADASVMPDITSGLTNVTCFMIGERAAANLRAESGS
jgi:choline dehydrogenase-like flavoprotein